jgi:hypothetical protein
MADKEVSNKKGGRKRREEEQIKNYSDVKKGSLTLMREIPGQELRR